MWYSCHCLARLNRAGGIKTRGSKCNFCWTKLVAFWICRESIMDDIFEQAGEIGKVCSRISTVKHFSQRSRAIQTVSKSLSWQYRGCTSASCLQVRYRCLECSIGQEQLGLGVVLMQDAQRAKRILFGALKSSCTKVKASWEFVHHFAA